MVETKYIIVKGPDGLGSNLMTIYTCYYIAKKHNLKLLIDWRYDFYNHVNKDIFEQLFDINDTDIELIDDDFKSQSYYPILWNDRTIHKKIKIFCKVPKKLVFSNYKTFLKLLNKYETFVVISKFFDQEINNWLLKKELKLKLNNNVGTIIDTFYNKHMINKYVICVHYRHGNGELHNRRLIDVENQYFEIIDNEIKNIDKDYVIFISTDSKEKQDKFVERYGDKCTFTKKWFPPKNRGPLHNNKYCNNNYNNILNAMLDIHLLSKYDKFVCSNSSWFSKYAIYLSNNDNISYVNILIDYK